VSAYHDIYTWAVSTVTNYGTIHGDDLDGNGVGIGLFGGGQVTNGSASDTRAFIAADGTVVTAGAVATITNYGTIACLTRGEGDGVLLLEGGVFTNGSRLCKNVRSCF
jgi:hypothetical protein